MGRRITVELAQGAARTEYGRAMLGQLLDSCYSILDSLETLIAAGVDVDRNMFERRRILEDAEVIERALSRVAA